ncbi:nuclear transport factor 2 family protein [Plantactinospora sp. CA-294935]|uniref:nuclear transport factor 2 family protein n=1 Tax=Plantactinospora sp. CA-294935 TaxID=3240012 RepID=UPI003D8C9617
MSTPSEAFTRIRDNFLANTAVFDEDQLAEDVVVEMPFAAPGRPNRIEGRREFLDFAAAGRAQLPLRIDDCRNVVIHETTDPEVIVVEYELAATVTTTGISASAPFIAVLRVRDGRVAHWREYQNPAALALATGQD